MLQHFPTKNSFLKLFDSREFNDLRQIYLQDQ